MYTRYVARWDSYCPTRFCFNRKNKNDARFTMMAVCGSVEHTLIRESYTHTYHTVKNKMTADICYVAFFCIAAKLY